MQKSNSPSVVSIALDVDGKRFTKKLPSDMALWQVLRQFENAQGGLNVTGRASPKSSSGGQLYYEAPLVNIMGREYSALEELQKTLSQCGINSGSMVLRVSFRQTDKTLHEAMEELSQYLKDIEPEGPIEEVVNNPVAAGGSAAVKEDESSSEAAQSEIVVEEDKTDAATVTTVEPSTSSDAMDVDKPSAIPNTADHLQPTGIFSAPSSSTPVAATIREDDSVYEPTIAHAQLRQQQLLARAQNTRLKSDAELAADAAEEAAKLAKVTKVDIKVRFPDQTSAQWTISPVHTGAFLYQAIRGVMAHPSQPFKLTRSGPMTAVQDDDKTLVAGYRLKGRELLNLSWEETASAEARKAPFLKSSVASQAQAVVVPEVPQAASDEGPGSVAGPSTKPVKSEKGEYSMDSDAIRKKLGKLFKLPGKK